MLLLGAKGAREGPRADFSSILASILVSLGGLLEALGVFRGLLSPFGNDLEVCWVLFGYLLESF